MHETGVRGMFHPGCLIPRGRERFTLIIFRIEFRIIILNPRFTMAIVPIRYNVTTRFITKIIAIATDSGKT